MFILNPDQYLVPCYRISPFKTADISFNSELPDDESVDDYFFDRFKGRNYTITNNGREALYLALSQYNLEPDDIVTILTTSGNYYISSCVTTEIEKICSWSRKIESNTRVILINHEFGYPFERLSEIENLRIPVIEDCAHSFFSSDRDGRTGFIGDYVIFSFPKMFPLQVGGLLVSSRGVHIDSFITRECKKYIRNVLSYYIHRKEWIIEKRLLNYMFLSELFNKLGFSERFAHKEGITPGVFMFEVKSHGDLNLAELKKNYYSHGVQCSVFYGEQAFFLPVHQYLSEYDMIYFSKILESFMLKK